MARKRRNLSDVYNDDNQLLMYYLLPDSRRRLCQALKKISLQHERVDHYFWKERKQIMDKYTNLGFQPAATLTSPQAKPSPSPKDDDDDEPETSLETLHNRPLQVLAEKANQLKRLVEEGMSRSGCQVDESDLLVLQSPAIRSLIDRCESKCHEILTHLANIDFELRSCDSLTRSLFHREMENSVTNYHRQLSSLYMARLTIIGGYYEPTLNESELPSYLTSQQRPKSYQYELMIERLLSEQRLSRANHEYWATNQGLPDFWFIAFTIALWRCQVIHSEDKGPLRYLADVRFYFDTDGLSGNSWEQQRRDLDGNQDRHRTQVLLFFFDPNPYFDNRVLSKTLYLGPAIANHPEAEEKFDGLRVLRKEGCDINWLKCHFHHRHEEDTEEGDKDADEDAEEEEESGRGRSFFNFFSPDGLTPDDANETTPTASIAATNQDYDYQIFAYIRDFVVPHAIIAYSRGHLYGFASADGRQSLDWPAQYLSARRGYLNELGVTETTASKRCNGGYKPS